MKQIVRAAVAAVIMSCGPANAQTVVNGIYFMTGISPPELPRQLVVEYVERSLPEWFRDRYQNRQNRAVDLNVWCEDLQQRGHFCKVEVAVRERMADGSGNVWVSVGTVEATGPSGWAIRGTRDDALGAATTYMLQVIDRLR